MTQSLKRTFEEAKDAPKRSNHKSKKVCDLTHADIVNSASLGSKSYESIISPARRPTAGSGVGMAGGTMSGAGNGGMEDGNAMYVSRVLYMSLRTSQKGSSI